MILLYYNTNELVSNRRYTFKSEYRILITYNNNLSLILYTELVLSEIVLWWSITLYNNNGPGLNMISVFL